MKIDFLIVGFGIAGAAVAHKCLKENKSFLIIDDHKISASKISAGMFTPIRGKRFALQDNYDLYFDFALNFYNDSQLNIGDFTIERQDTERFFNSIDEKYFFLEKYSDKSDIVKLNDSQKIDFLNFDSGSVFFKKSGYLDVKLYLELSQLFFNEKNMFRIASFDYKSLKFSGGYINYDDIVAKNVVFTEGFRAMENPLFTFLPFQNAKSEVLLIESDTINFDHVINADLWIKPMENHISSGSHTSNRFLVGATHAWDEFSFKATQTARDKLSKRLNKILNVPFKIVGQLAAVKPVVKDRKVIWGTLPDRPVSILNGLGSSGVLKAPYYANKLVDSIINNKFDLDEEHIERFF